MDFVVQHALDNVWAESVQDKDYYIRPARITPNGGSLKYAEVGITSIALPITDTTTRVFYHVYHIGFFYCCVPMTNDNNCFIFLCKKSLKNTRFSQCINRTGWFIQNNHWTIAIKVSR